jgi:hypothetical protein
VDSDKTSGSAKARDFLTSCRKHDRRKERKKENNIIREKNIIEKYVKHRSLHI